MRKIKLDTATLAGLHTISARGGVHGNEGDGRSDRDLIELGQWRALGASPTEVAKKIEGLESDNRKYRQEEKPALERELGELRPLKGEGVVVLQGDDAKEYQAFKALGLKAADIATERTELVTLREKDTRRTADDQLVEAAGVAKLKATVLRTIKGLEGAQFSTKDGQVPDGKGGTVAGKVAYITPPGENQQAVELNEWLKANVPAEVAAAARDGAAPPATPARPAPRSFIPQGTAPAAGTSGGGGGDATTQPSGTALVDSFLAQNRAAAEGPNPLFPNRQPPATTTAAAA